MAIVIGIDKKGVKDLVIVAKNSHEGKELISLYHEIEPEMRAFEDLLNEKLNPENLDALKTRGEQG